MAIRAAVRADLAACLDIYNHYVEHSVATFDTQPLAGAAAERWFRSHESDAHPLLVADQDGEVIGYGSLSRWSSKAGYDKTSEVSVFIRPDHQRCGAGAGLLDALLIAAQRAGHRNLLARVEASNTASINLFKTAGFRSVGVLHETGFKFGRWLDVVIMERLID